jgi:hypothetical protein
MTPVQKYPALMTYINSRNLIPSGRGVDRRAVQERGETPPLDRLDQLRVDSAAARAGGLAEVAREMAQAASDLFTQRAAKGLDDRPHPSAMAEFLGLASEAEHGCHMAGRVLTSWLAGKAERDANGFGDTAPKPEREELKEDMEATGGD